MKSHDQARRPNFETVRDSAARLQPADKLRLWQFLEAEIGLAEEAVWEKNSEIQSEIREARTAYDAGDYVSLEEYLTDRGDGME